MPLYRSKCNSPLDANPIKYRGDGLSPLDANPTKYRSRENSPLEAIAMPMDGFLVAYQNQAAHMMLGKTLDGISWNVNEIILIDGITTDFSTAIKYVGNNVVYLSYLVFESPAVGDPYGGIEFCKSVDLGLNWTTQLLGVPSIGGASHGLYYYGCDMACPDANTIFLLTVDTYPAISTLLLWRSTNGGISWSEVEIDSGVGAWDSNIAIYAIDMNTIFITYHDPTGTYVKFAKSINGGTSWVIRTVAPSAAVSYAETQDIVALDINNIFISYIDYPGGGPNNLYFAKSIDGGDSWSTSLIHAITENNGYAWKTAMAVTDINHIFILYELWTYEGSTWKPKVALAKTSNGGISWSTDIVVGDGRYWFDIHAKDSNSLYVSHGGWYSDGASNIYLGQLFSKSINGGNTWATQTVDSTLYTGRSNGLTPLT